MKDAIRVWGALLIFALAACAMPGAGRAETTAMEELLSICEKNGAVTPKQAQDIRGKIEREKQESQKRASGLEEKFKALLLWENELSARQKALIEYEKGSPVPERSPDAPQAPPAGVFPTQQALEAAERFPGENSALLSTLLGDQEPENPNKVWYKEGFCIGDSANSNLCIRGLLQTDYRYIDHGVAQTAENGFDIRRARLGLSGRLLKHFKYRFNYEFQGTQSRHLLDAYADMLFLDPFFLRVGQFKEPFGLEETSADKDLWFAERSMGYALAPQYDVGLMAHGSAWRDRIWYGVGLFNGNGADDASGGNVDDPQVTGRLVLAPFKNMDLPWVDNLQAGGSYSFSRIDSANVAGHVYTTGQTQFLNFSSGSKFHVIQDADTLNRNALEFAWAYGPAALCGEYFHVLYSDVQTSTDTFDLDMKAWYLAGLVMLTGEEPLFKKGVLAPTAPARGITHDGPGAVGIAFRYDNFEAGRNIYEDLVEEGSSAREAEAYSLAIHWYPEANIHLLFDFTRTYFDTDLEVGRDPIKGTAEYTDKEDVFTGRFQVGF